MDTHLDVSLDQVVYKTIIFSAIGRIMEYIGGTEEVSNEFSACCCWWQCLGLGSLFMIHGPWRMVRSWNVKPSKGLSPKGVVPKPGARCML